MKFRKTILTGCVLTTAVVCGGFAVASADTALYSKEGSFGANYTPDIAVEWGEYTPENVPQAVLGKTYRIFDATAEDVYGEKIAVNAKVWLHYTESTKSLVTVKDNTITPDFCGIYTVEYIARDTYGNVATYTYDFLCTDTEVFSIQLSDADESGLAGYEMEIATASFENAQGVVTEKITATLDDGKVVYDITGEQSFVPMYAGTYTISYEYKDYNQTVTDSYEVTVEEHDTPIFFENAPLPAYFIVGKPYTLPSVKAYQFGEGKPFSVTPEITVGLGTERTKTLGADRAFTAEKEGELTVRYTISFNGNKRVQEHTARAVDVGYGDTNKFDISKYFYAPDSLLTVNSNEVVMTTEKEGSTATFINSLVSHKIDFDFAIAQGGNNFGKLNILLTDSLDPSIVVKFSYIKSGIKESLFSVNDSRGSKITASFYSTNLLSFSYSEKTMTASLAQATVGVSKTLNGEEFTGFPSGKVNFSISVSDVSGRMGLYLSKLNNQTLYKTSSDRTAPMITFSAYEGGEEQVGNTVTVNRCFVGDVLDTEYTVQYAIKSPSGQYVIDEDGVLLSEEYARYDKTYSFRVRELGGYTVQITAMDSAGNKSFYSYAISVTDQEAPKVQLQTEMKEEVKVGEAFNVGELVITDDVSTEFTVTVYIITPRLKTQALEIGEAFTPTYAGEYTLSYMVTDEAGNVTIINHTFRAL